MRSTASTRATRVLREHPSDNISDALSVVDAATAAIPHVEPWQREDAAITAYLLVRGATRYVADVDDQNIRMPWRLLSDAQGDCKSSAVFIAAFCAAAGCDVAIRFVVWPGEVYFGHVFAVVDGIPVDPLFAFGDEDQYTWGVDIPL